MTEPKIGVVPLSRPTFDLAGANLNRRASLALLDRLGLEITGPRGLMLDAAGLMRAARTLAGTRPDLLLLLQLTFTPAAQTVRIARTVRAPMVLLWGFPESAERRGRPSSLRGMELAVTALASAGIDCRLICASADDPAVTQMLADCLTGGDHS